MCRRFKKYFYDIVVECPYGLPRNATFRQAQFGFIPNNIVQYFLEHGFRRNGNYLYTMACDGCTECIPIRLIPISFTPNRNQKRVWLKNKDIEVRVSPLYITNEKLAICDKFLHSRFPGRGNTALEYYAGFFVNTLGHTYEIEFRHQNSLVGVSIIDIFENSINCVYFYFDPDKNKKSPGTFNILYLIDYALHHNIDFIYLGYLIRDVPAMSYKSRFTPHQLLIEGKWTEGKG